MSMRKSNVNMNVITLNRRELQWNVSTKTTHDMREFKTFFINLKVSITGALSINDTLPYAYIEL